MSEETKIEIYRINPEQGERALALNWAAEQLAVQKGLRVTVPTLFIGAKGCGKTGIPFAFLDKLNGKGKDHQIWMLPVSYMDVGEMGIPVPDMERRVMDWFVRADLPFDNQQKGVIVLDELDRNEPQVQNMMMQVLLGRIIYGRQISPQAYVCATANGTTDVYTTALSGAQRARLCSLFVSKAAAGHADSYDNYAQAHGISAIARTFMRYDRELLAPEPALEELAECEPRTLDMADCIYQAAKSVTFQTEDILRPCIAGVIGRRACARFMEIEEQTKTCPTVAEIIADPTTAKLPPNVSLVFATICALNAQAEALKQDRAALDSVAQYLARLPAELAALGYKRFSKAAPVIVTTKAFQTWVNTHKALLI